MVVAVRLPFVNGVAWVPRGAHRAPRSTPSLPERGGASCTGWMVTLGDGDTVTLRPLRPGDARQCARIHYRGWRETYGDLLPQEHWESDTLPRRERMWEQKVLASDPVTVAEVGGAIAGFAMAGAPRGKGGVPSVAPVELYALYVAKEFHGRGVGQALLDELIPWPSAAEVWAAEENPRALRFYAKNGFVPDGTRLVDRYEIAEIRLVRADACVREAPRDETPRDGAPRG